MGRRHIPSEQEQPLYTPTVTVLHLFLLWPPFLNVLLCPPLQIMAKPGESPVGRQHQSHPEETEEELREHQEGGASPGVIIKQEPLDPQEVQEEALQQQRERDSQTEQELLFRQVEDPMGWF